MKKLVLVLIMVLSLIAAFSSVAFAAEQPISVVVNDNKLMFLDAKPFLDGNGRAQTPAKYIGEALGATVTWYGKEQKAVFNFGNKELTLYIGQKYYLLNGQTKQMDSSAILKDGRTFVPAKYIAEAVGANVKWDGLAKTVYINSTLSTQYEGNDVVSGTIVSSKDELLKALAIATYTLQPTVELKCKNFGTPDFNLDNLVIEQLGLKGVDYIRFKSSTINNVADLTVNITYSQVHKIRQAVVSNIALGRLSNEDVEVSNKVKDIISQVIKDNMTDYEKELAIHDYLVLNYKYDYENLKNGTLPNESYTPYGLLIKGTGVCQAYAEATELLLNAVGIECMMVTGTADGVDHAWNIVKLDNEYYMLDVTWDDPVPDEQGRIKYDYFNVTSEQLARDHIWDSSKWSIAKGTKYNYFIYNNLVVNNYSEFKQMVIKKILEGKKEILVYINDYDKNEYDLNFVFDYYSGSVSSTVPDTTNTAYMVRLE